MEVLCHHGCSSRRPTRYHYSFEHVVLLWIRKGIEEVL
jgi:hypothetical protein